MFIKYLPFSDQELQILYASLQKNNGAIYLDSASSEHVNSNFSVFVWQPDVTIESTLFESRISKERSVTVSEDDPLDLVNTYLNQTEFTKYTDASLPFVGGAVGFWDYELGGRFERLPAPRNNDITLPNMFVGIYTQGIVHDHKNQQVYYFNHKNNASALYDELLAKTKQLLAEHKQLAHSFKLKSAWQSNMNKAEYSEKFQRVQEYLHSGDCYQINLAQRFSAEYQGDEWQAYQQLRQQNSAPFSGFIRLAQGAVLSVSPERFLQVVDNQVETKPIKGTRPRGQDKTRDLALAEELRNATKDRAENVMIVDLLRNDLSKVAQAGSVKVPALFEIESFPAVHHLVSTVTATIRAPFTSLDLLRGAFPGGSITGAPKIRAMEIIHELEPNPRSVYCGAIGYIKPNGDMDTNITIRTLVCNQGKVYCWAGGGLVADSKCDDEYQETLDKVHRILPVLSDL
ncbi:MAG: aminodeoxychorismate synthase component I [Gammaproteobacteria bacterium]|nr:aminodeoxychorismate synthase component I [Gammaproteobacteria bacterium]